MNEFLKGILDGIYALVGNYGWSIVVFTLLIKLILSPFDYKSRVSMRKTTKIQPQIAAIQKKYAKDQDKMNQKMSELYRKEKINPLSSCLPMLLTMPVLFAMFAAMRMMANEQQIQQAFAILQGNAPAVEGWLWIKNVWMPDSPFSPVWPDLSILQQISADRWVAGINALDPAVWSSIQTSISNATGVLIDPAVFKGNLQSYVNAIYTTMSQTPSYVEHVAKLPGFSFNLIITQLEVFRNYNGFFILPVVSAVSQFLMTKMQGGAETAPAASNDPKAQSQQSTSNFMKWFFPLFSLWICAGYNAAFAIYWVASNLFAMAETFAINKYLDMKEKKESIAAEGNVK